MKTSLQDGMLRHYQEEAKMSDVNVERQIAELQPQQNWVSTLMWVKPRQQNENYRKVMKDAGRGRLLP